MLDWKSKNVLVTGGRGFLGSRIVSLLKPKVNKIIVPESRDYDLREKECCKKVVKNADIVFHVAGVTGGIGFIKKHPGSVFYDNLMMGTNLIEESRKAHVEKFISTGTVCSYPKFTPVPFKEEQLWNGYPEETNASYGLSKKMQIVQSMSYHEEYNFNSIVLVLTNMYGPEDNFDLETSHVIPAIITKIYEAKLNHQKEIILWGDGTPSRDFIHVDDAARAFVLAAERYNKPNPVNIGGGFEITINELAKKIMTLMNVELDIKWNSNKPNGQPRRVLDITKAQKEFGFKPEINFEEGLKDTIKWFLSNVFNKL